MKKLPFFFIFTAVMAFGQQTSTLQTALDIKAGFNFSSITNDRVKDNDDYSSVFGFQLGVAFDIGIMSIGTNAFYFQPGLMFITKGHNYSYSKKGYDEYNKPFNLSDEATWNLYYLELPLMALMKIPVSENLAVALNAGPYFAFGLSGTKTYEWNGFDEKTKGEIDLFDNNVQRERLGRFDAGLGFGAGIEYTNYYIGLSYDLGLKDMAYNAVQVGGSNRTFGINLGYRFGRAPKEEKQPEPPQPVAQPEPPPPQPEPQPVAPPEPEPHPQPIVHPEPESVLPKKSEKDSLAEIEPVLVPVQEIQEVPQQEQPVSHLEPEHPVPQIEPQVQPPPEPPQQPQLEQQPKAEQPSVQPEPQVQQPQPQLEQQAQTEHPARHTITVDVMPAVVGITIGKVGKKIFDSMLEDFKFKDMDDVSVSVNTDLSGLGFAFQYEYQPFESMSLAARFAYLGMGASMNSKVTKSLDILEVGLNSKLEGDISLLSAEGHLRTYTFGGIFFLDLVLGYTDVSMSFKGEDLIESDFGTMELESIKFKASQGFFKPGFKFGWRVSFGKNGGFVFEPALNFCYAMRLGSSSLVEQIMKETGRKYSKNVKNIDEKMELIESIGLIGGPGFSLSFGYRF